MTKTKTVTETKTQESRPKKAKAGVKERTASAEANLRRIIKSNKATTARYYSAADATIGRLIIDLVRAQVHVLRATQEGALKPTDAMTVLGMTIGTYNSLHSTMTTVKTNVPAAANEVDEDDLDI